MKMTKTFCCVLALSVFLPAVQAALPGADALSNLIYSQFDLNNDSNLDAREWQSGTTRSFDDMDSNGDNRLDGDEMASLKDQLVSETGELAAELVAMLTKNILLSLDGDGDKVVTKEEYNKPMHDIFDKLDANMDGKVNSTELNELAALAMAKK